MIATKNKDINTGIFMFWSGIGSTVVALISPLVGMRMELIKKDSAMGKLANLVPILSEEMVVTIFCLP